LTIIDIFKRQETYNEVILLPRKVFSVTVMVFMFFFGTAPFGKDV
jgi:hypothetical protein